MSFVHDLMNCRQHQINSHVLIGAGGFLRVAAMRDLAEREHRVPAGKRIVVRSDKSIVQVRRLRGHGKSSSGAHRFACAQGETQYQLFKFDAIALDSLDVWIEAKDNLDAFTDYLANQVADFCDYTV